MDAEPERPSALFEQYAERLAQTALLGPVVDLACGRGRHALSVAERGLPCVGIDRNRSCLCDLRDRARDRSLGLSCVRSDLETEFGLPLRINSCGAILVFRFLYRPLASAIETALAPGGLLLYETFTTRQRELGWGPSRAAFLLDPGELAQMFPRLETLAYSEGPSPDRKPEESARLAAIKPIL